MDLEDHVWTFGVACCALMLGFMCMLSVVLGFLMQLCDRPMHVVPPIAMLESKEERDIDIASMANDANVVDSVRRWSASDQVLKWETTIGPSHPLASYHGGSGRPSNCDGIFANRLLSLESGSVTLEIVKSSYNCNRRKYMKHKFYAVDCGRYPGIYHSWPKAKWLVEEFSCVEYQAFRSELDAQ